ncbi:type II toxin-antitoxin system mRNA interferase toxin, RelE/StbE family [Candidatus Roizmanbacteria bacterium]|nr:type II toxin-antitoxin system mRNA interferase toxin, RelE/StbE family [Candidatus Roizmanbacteria bacterium]
MYELISTEFFEKRVERLIKNNSLLKKKIRKTFKLLRSDPFYPGLETHKVNSKNFGETFSSSVTSDIRVIWLFDKGQILIILLLDIGGHSGSRKVYS